MRIVFFSRDDSKYCFLLLIYGRRIPRFQLYSPNNQLVLTFSLSSSSSTLSTFSFSLLIFSLLTRLFLLLLFSSFVLIPHIPPCSFFLFRLPFRFFYYLYLFSVSPPRFFFYLAPFSPSTRSNPAVDLCFFPFYFASFSQIHRFGK